MLIVEIVDKEIRIGNKFSFVGDNLVENITHKGIVSENYRKINMLNIKSFSFVEPYYVALSLIGMSKSEIDNNMVSGKLSLIDPDGFVFGSSFRIKNNQTPAFLDPSLYQRLSFVEIVFFDNDNERRFFFFDVDTDELSMIDFFKYRKGTCHTNGNLITLSKSSSFTTLTSVGERIRGNKVSFWLSNATMFGVIPVLLFCAGLINFATIVFFACIFSFNASSFFLLSGFSSSRLLLINPFVSYFCLSRKEFFSILRRGR